jgi:hypothetical protein
MEGISYLVSFAKAYPIAWIVWFLALWKCLIVLWRGVRTPDPTMRNEYVSPSACASWIILAGAAMTVAVGGDHFEGWRFFIPYWPLYFAVLVEQVLSLGTVMGKSLREKWIVRTATAILAGAVIGTYVYNPTRWADLSTSGLRNEFYLANLGRRIGHDLNLFFEGARRPSLGIIAAGGIGYAYEGCTVDLPGLNNVLMAHESKDRGGPKNHAVFDPRIFYRQLPDVIVALNPYCERGNPRRKFEAFRHDYRLLKHIHREPKFRRLYTPVVIPSFLRSGSFGLCLFMRRGFLEESERSDDIVSFTYDALDL